jgi:membrane-bound inhibitor of C-type lysozyme
MLNCQACKDLQITPEPDNQKETFENIRSGNGAKANNNNLVYNSDAQWANLKLMIDRYERKKNCAEFRG